MSAPQGLPAALGMVWGTIQHSVYQRNTTAELWSAVKNQLTESGYALPRGSFQMVNQLRSLAATQRSAMEAFASAGSETAIDPSMISQAIYSNSLQQQAIAPEYHVTALARFESAAGISEQQITLAIPTLLPMTVGGVMDELSLYAAGVSNQYTMDGLAATSVSLSNVTILSVGAGA